MVSHLKKCSHCGKQKPLGDFYESRHSRDGRGYLCKKCTYAKVREWQGAHPDQVREQQRRYRLKHAKPRKERKPPTEAELRERRQRRLERQREYYRAHREELRAWRRAWRKAHLREVRAYSREYYQAHRAHLLGLKAKYRKQRRAERAAQSRT
jgi:hypothetical protein